MIRHSAKVLPRLNDGESPKLIAMTTTYGLHAVRVTDYNCFDEEDEPLWSTACSNAYSIERVCILWWAYADDVQAVLEQLPISDVQEPTEASA